ncbi:helix-turn-helix domain-containing protein [Streptomyces viridochromogenes]|uniref:Putative AraC family transcriptional regulator n=1 Tax=Streptomyces viridochromogenes Tue57 TaxID=1160705 RepID=L8PID6_STRVR|nr:helix-turn-helix domain-containing protein [Streptomyces viridochromogenes]ELS57326.1 putative AraC family transcriptional regulator [Streptomyces viridochromogenes Tue57]
MLLNLEQQTEGRGVGAVRLGVPVHSRRCVLRQQIGAFIEHRLGDWELTPAAIAEAHHISVRYLYQVFDTHQMTVAAWIRHCRLEHCHRDLADPRLRTRSIRAIASRWGFSDAAHFSRAFRAAYGMSPGDHRQLALGHG